MDKSIMIIMRTQLRCQDLFYPLKMASNIRLNSQIWARSDRRWELNSEDKLRRVLLAMVLGLRCMYSPSYHNTEDLIRFVKDVPLQTELEATRR